MIRYFDSTFSTPLENLACDEALLDLFEQGDRPEILRVWEPTEYFVVLGYSSKMDADVNVPACRARNVPIFRRCTGGGTVVQGPGCLNYSLIMEVSDTGPLSTIAGTNAFVLECHVKGLELTMGVHGEIRGASDLALGDRKFSGNAQRRRHRCVLVHGTFLTGFDIALVEELLAMPSRQPAYRRSRSHKDFLVNLSTGPAEIKRALRQSWDAAIPYLGVPFQRIERLVKDKYMTRAWTFRV
jgi:lipoate-protein ligase A